MVSCFRTLHLEEERHTDLTVADEMQRREDHRACNPEDALPRVRRQVPEPHLPIHRWVQLRKYGCPEYTG